MLADFYILKALKLYEARVKKRPLCFSHQKHAISDGHNWCE